MCKAAVAIAVLVRQRPRQCKLHIRHVNRFYPACLSCRSIIFGVYTDEEDQAERKLIESYVCECQK